MKILNESKQNILLKWYFTALACCYTPSVYNIYIQSAIFCPWWWLGQEHVKVKDEGRKLLKITKLHLALSNYVHNGPSCICACVFFPPNHGVKRWTYCVLPSGADSCEMFGEKRKKKRRSEQQAVSDDPQEKQKQYVSNAYVSMHFELNHTSLYASLSWLQTENLWGIFFLTLSQLQPPPPQSSNPLPSCLIICSRHADPAFACCLLLSPLSLVGDATSHCDNSWIWKRPFKHNPHPLAASPCSLR